MSVNSSEDDGQGKTMQRRSRPGTPLSIESGGVSFVEERGRTFVVSQGSGADGAAGPSTEPDVERVADLVDRKFDLKEQQMKQDIRDELESCLARDRREHEESLRALRLELKTLASLTAECEGLKEMQKSLRKELSENDYTAIKQDKQNVKSTNPKTDRTLNSENRTLKRENHKLRDENQTLSGEIRTLTNENRSLVNENRELASENISLRQENDQLKKDNSKLETQLADINSAISDKESEISRLRQLIDSQYKKLQLDLTNSRDRFHTDHVALHADMRRQQLLLTEISHVVKHISTTSDQPQTGGNATGATGGHGSKVTPRRARQQTEALKGKSLTLDNRQREALKGVSLTLDNTVEAGKGEKGKQKGGPAFKRHGAQAKKR